MDTCRWESTLSCGKCLWLRSSGQQPQVTSAFWRVRNLLGHKPGQGQSLQGCATLEHTGHTSLDLYWPWKRSTMKESFLILCRCQAS